MIDLNTAEKQSAPNALIPDGAVVPVHATLSPGGSGPDNWLKRSKNGDSLALDFEFTVVDGEFARRKFWTLLTIEGETDGQKKAGEISRSRLRAMVESAKGIDPTDESEKAVQGRRIPTFADLDGLRFWAVVALEPGTNGYKDKNTLRAVVTPDKEGWTKLEQSRSSSAAPMASVAAVAAAPKSASRPSWAQ